LPGHDKRDGGGIYQFYGSRLRAGGSGIKTVIREKGIDPARERI
jgi:hypothetical protein